MKVAIRNRKFRKIECFFLERKMFEWGEVIVTGALACAVIWLTTFLFKLLEDRYLHPATWGGIKAMIVL